MTKRFFMAERGSFKDPELLAERSCYVKITASSSSKLSIENTQEFHLATSTASGLAAEPKECIHASVIDRLTTLFVSAGVVRSLK